MKGRRCRDVVCDRAAPGVPARPRRGWGCSAAGPWRACCPGSAPASDVARRLRDRAGDLAAELLDEGLGLGAGPLRQRAGQDERLAGQGQLARRSRRRGPPGRGRRPTARRSSRRRRVLGVLEELEDAGGDHRADLGDRFELGQRRGADRLQRREPLGQDLGAPGADVADRQAGQEAVERPRPCSPRARRRGSGPTSCPSAPGRPGSARRAGRGRPGSRTSPVATSWSMSFSPRPSMSIASRWANQRIHSLSWSGQRRGRVGAAEVDLARLAARPGRRSSGRSWGRRRDCSVPSRASASTRTTWGMISPAFSITTVSPTRMSLRAISSALCRLARLTVVPASGTGVRSATGVSLPVLPTWTLMPDDLA